MVSRNKAACTTEVDVLIGKAIRFRRHSAKVSQEELAETCGCSFQQVQKYEKGHNRVSAATLIKIARRLGCPPEALLPPDDPGEAERHDLVLAMLASPPGRDLAGCFPRLKPADQRALATMAVSLMGGTV